MLAVRGEEELVWFPAPCGDRFGDLPGREVPHVQPSSLVHGYQPAAIRGLRVRDLAGIGATSRNRIARLPVTAADGTVIRPDGDQLFRTRPDEQLAYRSTVAGPGRKFFASRKIPPHHVARRRTQTEDGAVRGKREPGF